MADLYKEALSADTTIYVAPYGDDNRANGSFESPFATIAAAIAAITSTKKTVLLMPGEYTHSTDTDITVNGTKIIGLGGVEIDASGCTTYAFKTVFGTATGTKEVTFANFSLDSGAKVGIQLQNTGATAKINCYIKDVNLSADSASYSSIDIDHAVATHAIRVYLERCTTEGKVDMVPANAGDRIRFMYCTIRGGIVTSAADIDLEILCAWCIILLAGITGGHANQRCILVACATETDADPNVYLGAVAGDVATQTEQLCLIPGA